MIKGRDKIRFDVKKRGLCVHEKSREKERDGMKMEGMR